jgi:hypothetical protein
MTLFSHSENSYNSDRVLMDRNTGWLFTICGTVMLSETDVYKNLKRTSFLETKLGSTLSLLAWI